MPTALEQTVVAVPIEQVLPSPNNPRRIKDDDPSLAELAGNIEARGQLQNIVVRQHPKKPAHYELLAGERRWRAMKRLKLDTIRAAIVVCSDDEALDITVSENLQREDLKPLEEARGVATLLASGRKVEDVADKLGKPVGWVTRRARIDKLSQKWKALAEDPKARVIDWPATALEVIARLEPDAQDAFLKDRDWIAHRDVESVEELERVVSDYTRKLSGAPWSLEDETLLPKAGSCLACTKRASCHKGLFDDVEDRDGHKLPKNDRCLDPLCWEKKGEAQVKLKLAELKNEHGNVMTISEAHYGYNEKLPALAKDAVKHHEVRDVPKSAKGAEPALVVDGPRAGTVRYVKPESHAEPKKRKAAAEPRDAKEIAREKKEKLARRRLAVIADHLFELSDSQETQKAPGDKHDLLAYLVAFGVDGERNDDAGGWKYFERLREKGSEKEFMLLLWGAACRAAGFSASSAAHSSLIHTDFKEARTRVLKAAQFLGFTEADIEKWADEELGAEVETVEVKAP